MKQQDYLPEGFSGSHRKRRRRPSKEALGGTLTDKRRWISLYVLCMGMLMIVLDATVVNVALPSIQDDLGFSRSGLAWVVNAYLIAFGGLLLLAGRLGDLVPVGIATAVLAGRVIDLDKGIGFGDGVDVPGAVLITGSLMVGVYTIVDPAAEYGWGAGRTLTLGALSLVLLVAFVAREA